MPTWRPSPLLYEINTATWLHHLSHQAGRPITLADIPTADLDRLAALGMDGLWLMGVWQRSAGARQQGRLRPELQPGYRQALPDLSPDDIFGSPYAITHYQVEPAFGGDAALATLRTRLQRRGLALMLDFVPNHMALDTPWLHEHPEIFLEADDGLLRRGAGYSYRHGGRPLAHGRDPYFPGWTDTVQLDYRRSATRRHMADTLLQVAERCDGVRCDMAMLLLQRVFLQTWGGHWEGPEAEFWADAIQAVKARHPGFLLLAEVYWDLEPTLQDLGFDATYDKGLYDALRAVDPARARAHLVLPLHRQQRMARFIENHDEDRAATAFPGPLGPTAAVLALTAPGLRLIHQGQLQGFTRRLPVQLGRRHPEHPDTALLPSYQRLLEALRAQVFHTGTWQWLTAQPAWPGSDSHTPILAWSWCLHEERRLVVANLSHNPAQAYLPWGPEPLPVTADGWSLNDLLSEELYLRQGAALQQPGLYLDLPPLGVHLFQLRAA